MCESWPLGLGPHPPPSCNYSRCVSSFLVLLLEFRDVAQLTQVISIIPLIWLRIEIKPSVIKVGDRPPLLLIFIVEVPSHDVLWVRERRTPLEECSAMMQKHDVRPMFSWGTLDKMGQRRWKRLACEDEFARSAAQAVCPGAAPRPTIKVLVWNRINGYLNWLEPDTVRKAKCECSTECLFVNRRDELSAADAVVFHGATRSAPV